jgi:hypothetical protein
MNIQINNTVLYQKLISDANIYNAIYSLESYIFEKGLLSEKDIVLFNKLLDKYDFEFIDQIVKECQIKLEKMLLNNDELFDIEVYFKIKKEDPVTGIEFRPIHTADLITQICIVSLLNLIMFEDESLNPQSESEIKNNEIEYRRNLSDISKLIPSYFYGNIPSTNVDYLFLNWKTKYQEYSSNIIDKFKEYKSNSKYTHEVCLDLKQFFPSINPNYIYSFVIEKFKPIYSGNELECLKQILRKLLFFNIKNIEPWIANYYPKEIQDNVKHSKLFFNVGIPQGLPQAYYFGNLCMIEVSKVTLEKFSGDPYYYVDDSVIYTDKASKKTFEKDIESINKKIKIRMNNLIIAETIQFEKELKKFHESLNYEVEIYSNSKSTIAELSSQKYGFGELSLIAQPTSGLNLVLNSTIDDLEDTNQKNKINSIIDILKKEILFVKSLIDVKKILFNDKDQEVLMTKNYLKLLSRYNKFYKFRLSILNFRDNNEISQNDLFDFLAQFMKGSKAKIENLSLEQYVEKSKIDFKKFFDVFDGDLFQVESNLYIRYLETDSILLKDFTKAVIALENKFLKENNERYYNALYFTKDIKSQSIFKNLQPTTYKSLPILIGKFIQPCTNISKDKELEILKKFSERLRKSNYIDAYFQKTEISNKIKFIYFTSDEFKRKLLNTLFSHIINVNANDDYCFMKNNNRVLKYFELRILTLLRNRQFSSIDFKIILDKILLETGDDIACDKIE